MGRRTRAEGKTLKNMSAFLPLSGDRFHINGGGGGENEAAGAVAE